MAKSTRKDPTPALRFAQKLALSGDVQAAWDAYGVLASGGNASAKASLAEMLAFKGEWLKVVDYAGAFLADVDAPKPAVVFDDMVRLMVAAGRATQSWAAILVTAKSALPASARNSRATSVLTQLAEFAQRIGKTVGEPLAEKPHKRAEDDELLHRYERNHKVMSFDNVVAAARVAASRGHAEEAWRMIEPKLPLFHPKDLSQVLPVVLVTDPVFDGMITGARAQIVLTTPRGVDH